MKRVAQKRVGGLERGQNRICFGWIWAVFFIRVFESKLRACQRFRSASLLEEGADLVSANHKLLFFRNGRVAGFPVQQNWTRGENDLGGPTHPKCRYEKSGKKSGGQSANENGVPLVRRQSAFVNISNKL